MAHCSSLPLSEKHNPKDIWKRRLVKSNTLIRAMLGTTSTLGRCENSIKSTQFSKTQSVWFSAGSGTLLVYTGSLLLLGKVRHSFREPGKATWTPGTVPDSSVSQKGIHWISDPKRTWVGSAPPCWAQPAVLHHGVGDEDQN